MRRHRDRTGIGSEPAFAAPRGRRGARLAALAIPAALALAACGADDDAGPTTTQPPSVTTPTTTIDREVVATTEPPAPETTLSPDTPRAGPLFGSGSDAAAEQGDPPSESCAELGDCGDGALELPEVDPFVPRQEYAAFCALLADIEQREAPDDGDFATIDAWFAELAAVVPAELAEPFGVLDATIDQVMALGVTDLDDPDPQLAAELDAILADVDVEAAAERLGDATDAECYGRTPVSIDVDE